VCWRIISLNGGRKRGRERGKIISCLTRVEGGGGEKRGRGKEKEGKSPVFLCIFRGALAGDRKFIKGGGRKSGSALDAAILFEGWGKDKKGKRKKG